MDTIIKKVNIKVLVLSFLIAAISVIAFISADLSTGILLILLAMVLFAFRIKHEVYNPTGSPVKRSSFYFDKDNISALENILRGEIDENTLIIYFNDYGSGRLDVMMTKDEEFAVVKLLKFVPHKYEDTSDFIEFSGERAKRLAKYLKKCQR